MVRAEFQEKLDDAKLALDKMKDRLQDMTFVLASLMVTTLLLGAESEEEKVLALDFENYFKSLVGE
jgi:hypothetical protein